ncbi:glutaminyl-peptide cyclotransferase [Streptomyces sp. NPDC001530]|uniref:glutaminyl-peptide cyclotransferase n=1 Tax=Streptomyces sp. NPDC001530 TaxID=3364582 RepID=UPI0036CE1A13
MRLKLVVRVAAVLLVGGVLAHPWRAGSGAVDRVSYVRGAAEGGPEQLRAEVLETLPHDPRAFTEGLEMAGGRLYEGTGLAGHSSLRAGPPGKTPAVRVELPAPLFGEGVTVLGRTLWQLTWRNGIAVERDARTLVELRRVRYEDDGWGMCYQRDRGRVVTSNGSSRLVFRDPRTLARTGEVTVTSRGRPVARLNELECVGGSVYANVWPSHRIVRIDADTGAVTGEISVAPLLNAEEQRHADVLNGIAAVPGTDEFLLTGKWWPKMYRVVFVAG